LEAVLAILIARTQVERDESNKKNRCCERKNSPDEKEPLPDYKKAFHIFWLTSRISGPGPMARQMRAKPKHLA